MIACHGQNLDLEGLREAGFSAFSENHPDMQTYV